jgi:hypothetical protein
MEIILIQNIHPIEINGGGGVYVSRRVDTYVITPALIQSSLSPTSGSCTIKTTRQDLREPTVVTYLMHF